MVEIRTDMHEEIDRLLTGGVSALENKEVEAAHRMFREAYEKNPEDTKAQSYYGYTLAVVEDKVHKGLELCNKACRSGDAVDALLFNNLALVYLKLNRKREAVGAFKRGLKIDRSNKKIYEAWKNTVGIRRKPAIPFLPRSNFLNKAIGKWTYGQLKKKGKA